MTSVNRMRRSSDGHDERNIARLSLILANKRVPSEMKHWVKEFPSPDTVGTSMRIECTAGHGSVVPHGVDNDVLLGLINAYVAEGMPDSGVVRLTAYRLLQLSSLNVGGSRYAALSASLRRLQTSTFDITDSWFDNEEAQYRSVTTSLVLKFVVLDGDRRVENLSGLRSESLLEITLDSDLTGSIRSGYIRPLDFDALRKLTQPLARLLFRILNEVRYPVDQATHTSYRVGVLAWSKHLGFLDDRAFRVRRALDPAHEQLLDIGFLKSVEYLGRGEHQEILYVFANELLPPADPGAVALLTQHGVSQPVAVQLAAKHGSALITRQVQHFERLLQGGYKARNKAALLVDVIREPDKYPDADGPLAKPVKALRRTQALEDDAEPPRTVAGARLLLSGVKAPELVLMEAAELFVEGLVSTQELLDLRQDENAGGTILLWGVRRHHSTAP